ncbi:glycosyltransferase [Microbacterium azadirachtae]|uniref:glycosyltransferase n=1 Tax=Microbacterium azadirachtae TaxID=582680 RepID=UPI003F74DF47
MRILVVCSDADIGGAERLLATLASARRPEDTLALAVLMRPGTLSARLEASFDEVHYLGFPPTSRNLFGMVRALERVARGFEPDVVWSNLFHADLVTALARLRMPRVTTAHTQRLGAQDHPLTRLIARAVGLLSFRFQAVVPTSDSAQMQDFLRSLRMRNVRPAILNTAPLPAAPSFRADARQFLSLARNHPVKGHAVLFRAFAAIAEDHPAWSLAAYGPGVTPDDPAMARAIADADAGELVRAGRIRLLGPTDHPEDQLSDASALVISSLYGETFPLVGIEAAGAGVPVITSDLGNCAAFADDKRYVVRPGDAEELAAAMAAYADAGDAARAGLSAAARTRSERDYDPRVGYEAYRAVFASLTSAKAPTR